MSLAQPINGDLANIDDLISKMSCTDIDSSESESDKLLELSDRLNHLLSQQSTLLGLITRASPKKSMIKEKLLLADILHKINEHSMAYDSLVQTVIGAKQLQSDQAIAKLEEEKRAINDRTTTEVNQIVQRFNRILRQKAAAVKNLQVARCVMGITNLGQDMLNNKEGDLAELGMKPSENHLAKEDCQAVYHQLNQMFATEIQEYKAVVPVCYSTSDAKPYLNAILSRDPESMSKWPLSHVIEIIKAYGKGLPPALEKYVVFLDVPLWNGGNAKLEEIIYRSTVVNEAVREANAAAKKE